MREARIYPIICAHFSNTHRSRWLRLLRHALQQVSRCPRSLLQGARRTGPRSSGSAHHLCDQVAHFWVNLGTDGSNDSTSLGPQRHRQERTSSSRPPTRTFFFHKKHFEGRERSRPSSLSAASSVVHRAVRRPNGRARARRGRFTAGSHRLVTDHDRGQRHVLGQHRCRHSPEISPPMDVASATKKRDVIITQSQ